jgi:hypothetical protein
MIDKLIDTPSAAGEQPQPLPTVSQRYFIDRYGVYALMALHIPLAIANELDAAVSTFHALLIFGVGLIVAIRAKSPENIVVFGAYITGVEVLWRMTRSEVFWEFGKYATIALMVLVLVRFRYTRIPTVALLYILPMLPSLILTFSVVPLNTAAQYISGALSGPLALMVAIWFFSYARIDLRLFRRTLFGLIIPIVGMAALSTYFLITRPDIRFGMESVAEVTGGYNPNQASSILGLGVLAIWLLLLYTKTDLVRRVVLLALGTWFAVISLLTFSRSGVFTLLLPVALLLVHSMGKREFRARSLALVGVSVLLFIYFLYPRLEDYTGGAFSARYTDPNLTNRDQIAFADLYTFSENALMGVGPGMSPRYRAALNGMLVGTHTEYSRVLAEHGLFGIISLLTLGALCWQTFQRSATSDVARGTTLAALSWSLVFMTHAATRIVAPSFLIGLTCATFVMEQMRDQKRRASSMFSRPHGRPQPGLRHDPRTNRF